MPILCCIPLCKNHYKKRGSTSPKPHLFRVPPDVERSYIWRENIGLGIHLNSNHRICELHFQPDMIKRYKDIKLPNRCIYRVKRQRVSLRREAVPKRFIVESPMGEGSFLSLGMFNPEATIRVNQTIDLNSLYAATETMGEGSFLPLGSYNPEATIRVNQPMDADNLHAALENEEFESADFTNLDLNILQPVKQQRIPPAFYDYPFAYEVKPNPIFSPIFDHNYSQEPLFTYDDLLACFKKTKPANWFYLECRVPKVVAFLQFNAKFFPTKRIIVSETMEVDIYFDDIKLPDDKFDRIESEADIRNLLDLCNLKPISKLK